MPSSLTQITADIVAAFVSKNSVRTEDVGDLLRGVHGKLIELAAAKAEPLVEAKPEPRVPIKKTITPGYLVSLEDGKHYKTLRRHLATYGLTPDEYRAKWGLPPDYPMVSRDYAERRSALAKSIGLGRKATSSDPAQAIADDLIDVIAEDVIGVEATAEHVGAAAGEVAAPKKRGRPAKGAAHPVERKVTPHTKPEDRAKARRAAEPAEGGSTT